MMIAPIFIVVSFFSLLVQSNETKFKTCYHLAHGSKETIREHIVENELECARICKNNQACVYAKFQKNHSQKLCQIIPKGSANVNCLNASSNALAIIKLGSQEKDIPPQANTTSHGTTASTRSSIQDGVTETALSGDQSTAGISSINTNTLSVNEMTTLHGTTASTRSSIQGGETETTLGGDQSTAGISSTDTTTHSVNEMTTAKLSCPTNYIPYVNGSTCFKVVTLGVMGEAAAMTGCASDGGTLMILNSADEFSNLEHYLKDDGGKKYRISGKVASTTTNWLTWRGDALPWVRWEQTPTGTGFPLCLKLSTSKKFEGYWMAECSCDTGMPYVCEIKP